MKPEESKLPAREEKTNPKKEEEMNYLSMGTSLGICFGVVFGIIFHQLAIGISIGVALGVGIGAALDYRKKGKDK